MQESKEVAAFRAAVLRWCEIRDADAGNLIAREVNQYAEALSERPGATSEALRSVYEPAKPN